MTVDTAMEIQLGKKGATYLAILEGDTVMDPREPHKGRKGLVIGVRRNPACLMRTLRIRWENAPDILEELEEVEFGPLED